MRTTLSRRKLLLAPSAYAILKPFVDCVEARADTPMAPACFVALHKTQGQYVGRENNGAPNWIPVMEGSQMKLPRLLASFEPVKEYLTFLVGFDNVCNQRSGGNWHDGSCSILTGAPFPFRGKETMDGPPKHESIHWHVAERLKTEPLILSPFFTKGQEGFAVGLTTWRRTDAGIKATVPIGQPADAYKAVFGELRPLPADDPRAKAQELSRRSLIDYILGDARRVQGAVGSAHRAQLEGHLEAIRAIEKELFTPREMPAGGTCATPDIPEKRYTERYLDKEHTLTLLEKNKLLQQIALATMRCGLRRVFGYEMNGHAGCEDMRPGLWNPEFFHPADRAKMGGLGYHFSHFHQSEGPVNTTEFEWVPKTEEFLMKEFFAPIVIGMKDTPAGGSNLLQQSLVFYSTSQSYNHSVLNHSFMLAGNAGGRLKSNRIHTFHEVRAGSRNRGSGRPHNDALITALHAWGHTDVKTFGDPTLCKGPLPGVLG
jgi:hypothetical protein